jgi:hypothetical protein
MGGEANQAPQTAAVAVNIFAIAIFDLIHHKLN